MTGNKVLSLIGLATKAGKTASGEFLTEREVKSGKAALVIVAGDASENFGICVIIIKYQSIFMKIKIPWGMQWENSSAHLLQYWMRDLQKESGNIWTRKIAKVA